MESFIIDNDNDYNRINLSKNLSDYTQEELDEELINNKKNFHNIDLKVVVGSKVLTTEGCFRKGDFLNKYRSILDIAKMPRSGKKELNKIMVKDIEEDRIIPLLSKMMRLKRKYNYDIVCELNGKLYDTEGCKTVGEVMVKYSSNIYNENDFNQAMLLEKDEIKQAVALFSKDDKDIEKTDEIRRKEEEFYAIFNGLSNIDPNRPVDLYNYMCRLIQFINDYSLDLRIGSSKQPLHEYLVNYLYENGYTSNIDETKHITDFYRNLISIQLGELEKYHFIVSGYVGTENAINNRKYINEDVICNEEKLEKCLTSNEYRINTARTNRDYKDAIDDINSVLKGINEEDIDNKELINDLVNLKKICVNKLNNSGKLDSLEESVPVFSFKKAKEDLVRKVEEIRYEKPNHRGLVYSLGVFLVGTLLLSHTIKTSANDINFDNSKQTSVIETLFPRHVDPDNNLILKSIHLVKNIENCLDNMKK